MRRRRRASHACGSIATRGGASARCESAPTARARCKRSERRASRHSNGRLRRRSAYASSPPMSTPELSRRRTFLSFQPPAVGDEEVEAVAETIRSGWLTTGPRAAELERRVAEMVGAKHAVAVSSGTAAIHLALVSLGIGPDDEVITSPITWPATANVVVHAGARPVFVDVRDSDLNIDPAEVVKAVTPRTKAILPVH